MTDMTQSPKKIQINITMLKTRFFSKQEIKKQNF